MCKLSQKEHLQQVGVCNHERMLQNLLITLFSHQLSHSKCVSKLKVFMIRHTCILHFHGRKKLLAIERRLSLKQFSRSICSESNGNHTAPASHFPTSREVASMSCYAHHGEIIMLADRKSMKHTPRPKISLLICQKWEIIPGLLSLAKNESEPCWRSWKIIPVNWLN